LQRTPANDGGRDEITGIRRIDDVYPDLMPTSRFAHSQIHAGLIGGPHNQRAAQHIIRMKWAAMILNDPLCSQLRERLGELGTDHDDQGIGFKKSLYFPGRNLATADHQTSLTLQIHEHWIITWHIPVLPLAFSHVP
jgi:hypothetical protein